MPPANNGQRSPIKPVMDVQRVSNPSSQSANSQPQIAPNQPANVPPIPQEMLRNSTKAKNKSYLLAIIIAVFIAAFIIAGSIFAFIISRDAPKTTISPQPATEEHTSTVVDGQATPETIDRINQVIDQQLNSVNDQQDFTPNDISDESLGL